MEMIALLLPDAMHRRLRLLCLLCIFLFFLVGPASRWVHAGVPKSQGFTQSSILRHAVPLIWLNYCLGPNYGRLWLHVCRCFSVLPSELCLLKFGSVENQLFVLVFTSLFVFLKSSYHTHHDQIRSAYQRVRICFTLVWFHLFHQQRGRGGSWRRSHMRQPRPNGQNLVDPACLFGPL